jgi:hypothetical protein
MACGWLTSDRWPASTSIVRAFIRFAMKRSRSGLMVRSCFETAYDDGLERQAATVVFAVFVSDLQLKNSIKSGARALSLTMCV